MEEEKAEVKRAYRWVYVVAILVVLLIAFGLFYVLMARQQEGRFPKNTYINGVDVSGMTASRAENALTRQAETYALTILERNGTETLTSEDIGLTYEDNGGVDALLSQYDAWKWILYRFRTDERTVVSDTSIDEALAEEAVRALACFTDYTAVEDARVEDDGAQYVVTSEVIGDELDTEAAVDAIMAALTSGQTEIDLEEEGLYLSPTVCSDDETLNATAERLNGYLEACITFDFGDDRIVTIDADVIRSWIVEDEDGALDLSYDLAYDFVKTEMAYLVDTFGLTHTVTTHSGKTIQLTGGDYGWCMARSDTTDKILAAVEAGSTETMEAEWQYTAKNMGIDDIGGTYVEISISEQTMWCYDDYELVVETPVVTGNVNKGNGTPYGSVWAIDGMKKDATLGTIDTMGYSSPVSYWMPFNGNVGIHDADGWRSAYGGEIYLTNGSHGCVNAPLAAAKTIFETVTIGTAVVVYDLSDASTVVVR